MGESSNLACKETEVQNNSSLQDVLVQNSRGIPSNLTEAEKGELVDSLYLKQALLIRFCNNWKSSLIRVMMNLK